MGINKKKGLLAGGFYDRWAVLLVEDESRWMLLEGGASTVAQD